MFTDPPPRMARFAQYSKLKEAKTIVVNAAELEATDSPSTNPICNRPLADAHVPRGVHDGDESALCAVMAEWSSGRDYQTRVANLRGQGTGPSANAGYFLTSSGQGPTVLDDGSPDTLTGSSGTDWSTASEAGQSISISDFYVAKEGSDDAASINAALADGKNLILTPGVYELDAPLKIDRADTVVLGLGYASLTPTAVLLPSTSAPIRIGISLPSSRAMEDS